MGRKIFKVASSTNNMATRDKQKLISMMLSKILSTDCQSNVNFEWLINKPLKDHFKNRYNSIMKIFSVLNGDITGLNSKHQMKLSPDAYFSNEWNFIFEFDELQHFTKYKKAVLENYPDDLILGFDKKEYIRLCDKYQIEALKKGPPGYRKPKDEFPFENGRAAQRAFFDAFRDFLPEMYDLNPTIRISEFEVRDILEDNPENRLKLKQILIKHFEMSNKHELIKKL